MARGKFQRIFHSNILILQTCKNEYIKYEGKEIRVEVGKNLARRSFNSMFILVREL
jgi:hypothetical protein